MSDDVGTLTVEQSQSVDAFHHAFPFYDGTAGLGRAPFVDPGVVPHAPAHFDTAGAAR